MTRPLPAYKILVLDASQRSALAVVRSLGKMNNIQVYTAEASPDALAAHSRYSSGYWAYPDPAQQPQEFIAWLGALQKKEAFSLVMPVTEITSQLILLHQDKLSHIKIPFPDKESVLQLADKGNLVSLAQKLSVPVPTSHLYAASKDVNMQAQTYPLVVKPCLSRIFTGSHWINTTVKIVNNADELRQHLGSSVYLSSWPFMLQEFIPGNGAGVFCLYNQGMPAVFFAHKRLREKPPQGGISVLCESAELDPQLVSYAQTLLSGAKWHGVAMVEFRVTPEGKAYLMEVNTRFWGSLQLSIDAGIDFPRLLVEQALGITGNNPVNTHYKNGQRLRWLLGDLDSLYLYLKGNYSYKEKFQRIISFTLPSSFHTRHEINRISDIKPAIYELKIYIKQLLGIA